MPLPSLKCGWLLILGASLLAHPVNAVTPIYRAAVVSGNPEATRIGLDILDAGGTAADSAVAVSLALGVAEPYGSGLGGKIAILYYEASSRKVTFINGMMRSPKRFPVETYISMPAEKRKRSFRAACVPGTVAGLKKMHQEHGRLNWKYLVKPAANLARHGFTLDQYDAEIFLLTRNSLASNPETRRLYLINGQAPKAGTTLTNPDLANTLDILAEQGPEAFYNGPIAKALATAMEKNEGWITEYDMRHYRANEEQPINLDWLGYEVYSSPSPTTGGGTVLLTLKALEAVDTRKIKTATDRFDLLGNALKTAYESYQSFSGADRAQYTQREALSSRNIRNLQDSMRVRMELSQSILQGKAPAEDKTKSTTHFIVTDSQGNVACITQSLGHNFGACVIAPGTGFLLNNGMNNFSTKYPGSPNYIAEDKQPRSTIAPTIILKNGSPLLAIGSPAGQRIPTGIAQVIMEALLFGEDLQQAIDEPRYHLRRPLSSNEAHNHVDLESNASQSLIDGLRARGWDVNLKSPHNHYYGGVDAILFTPEGYVLAAADPRRTNVAGYPGQDETAANR